MQINPIFPLTFQSKSAIKTEFLNGNIPLKKDITGHKLTKENVSNDHTIPKSKGGKSNLYNYNLMNNRINQSRGSKPLKYYIDLESLIEYIKVMLDVNTSKVNGIEYIKGFLRNLLRELRR